MARRETARGKEKQQTEPSHFCQPNECQSLDSIRPTPKKNRTGPGVGAQLGESQRASCPRPWSSACLGHGCVPGSGRTRPLKRSPRSRTGATWSRAPATSMIPAGPCHPDYVTCIRTAGNGSGHGRANKLDCGKHPKRRQIGTSASTSTSSTPTETASAASPPETMVQLGSPRSRAVRPFDAEWERDEWLDFGRARQDRCN
jgi:hypothetical protein